MKFLKNLWRISEKNEELVATEARRNYLASNLLNLLAIEMKKQNANIYEKQSI